MTRPRGLQNFLTFPWDRNDIQPQTDDDESSRRRLSIMTDLGSSTSRAMPRRALNLPCEGLKRLHSPARGSFSESTFCPFRPSKFTFSLSSMIAVLLFATNAGASVDLPAEVDSTIMPFSTNKVRRLQKGQSIDCDSHQNFDGAVVSNSCEEVAWCEGGHVLIRLSCSEGQFFDENRLNCVPKKDYECPTAQTNPPTSSPTDAASEPSPLPTNFPSKAASEMPSVSIMPTHSLTDNPTRMPSTLMPSKAPTLNPTLRPTPRPTPRPTYGRSPSGKDRVPAPWGQNRVPVSGDKNRDTEKSDKNKDKKDNNEPAKNVSQSGLMISGGISPSAYICPNLVAFKPRQVVGLVDDSDLPRASGLVSSIWNPGILFTHNDNGSNPEIFAITATGGQTVATFSLLGRSNADYEDMAIGTGPNGGSYIYVGDIGDIDNMRPSIQVIRMQEPNVREGSAALLTEVLELRYQDALYPTGIDAECLMIDPFDERLYIITKDTGRIYGTEALWGEGNDRMLLHYLGDMLTDSGRVTGCDISKSGQEILVKSYDDIYHYCRSTDESLVAILTQTRGTRLTYGWEAKGEAIAFGEGAPSTSYFTLSESAGDNTPLYRYDRDLNPFRCVDGVAFMPRRAVGFVTEGALRETSGIVAGIRYPNVLYTHNDSGENAEIFAIDANSGGIIGTFPLMGGRNINYKDITIGRGPYQGSYIYIGDIGDINNVRSSIQVYRVQEPNLGRGGSQWTHTDVLQLRYADANRGINSECLMMDPFDQRLYIITKETGRIYRTERLWGAGNDSMMLEFLGEMKADSGLITGCDMDKSGKEILVKFVSSVHYYCRSPNESLASVLTQSRGTQLPYGWEEHGEAIAFGEGSPSANYFTLSKATTGPAPLYRYDRVTRPSTFACTIGTPFKWRAMLGRVDESALPEASGIVAGVRNPTVLYTHNDSIGTAQIFAIDSKNGQIIGIFPMIGGSRIDYEDIAIGLGPNGHNYIYVGDMGDNANIRPSIQVYRMQEPDLSGGPQLSQTDVLELKYSDAWTGINAECMMFDPFDQLLYLITKDTGRIYRTERRWGEGSDRMELEFVGSMRTDAGLVTGCDISKSGREILVKFYSSVYYYCRGPDESLADVLVGSSGKSLPYGWEAKGEAIAFGEGSPSAHYYTLSGSQGRSSPLYRYDRDPYPFVCPAGTPFKSRQMMGTVDHQAIPAASGIVAGIINPTILYTHNEFSGIPQIFAIDSYSGFVIGVFPMEGGSRIDYEDIAIGSGPNGGSYIYVGDIGDDDASRSSIEIYRMFEPNLAMGPGLANTDVLKLRYNDTWAGIDSECMMFDPFDERFYIITKDAGRIYRTDRRWGEGNSTSTLEFLGELNTDAGLVTGCDMDKSGREILVKFYSSVYYYCRSPGESLADILLSSSGTILPYGWEANGEAIAFGEGSPSAHYYTLSGSRGASAPLYRYDRDYDAFRTS